MRAKPLPPAEFCRRPIDATDDDVRQGRYIIPFKKEQLRVIASDGKDWLEIYDPPVWEHVSVSLPHLLPALQPLMGNANLARSHRRIGRTPQRRPRKLVPGGNVCVPVDLTRRGSRCQGQ
jgi:hypothetical protein